MIGVDAFNACCIAFLIGGIAFLTVFMTESTAGFILSTPCLNAFTTLSTTGLIFDQFLIIKKAATAIAASTPITTAPGDVRIPTIPPNFLIILRKFENFIIAPPTPDTIFPKIKIAGPTAAAVPAILIAISTCASLKPLILSTTFCAKDVIFLRVGNILLPNAISAPSTALFNNVI